MDEDHVLIQKAKSLGIGMYGSNTMSDQALIDCPSIKMGPGDSLWSHSADEYILVEEIECALDDYLVLLDAVFLVERVEKDKKKEDETLG